MEGNTSHIDGYKIVGSLGKGVTAVVKLVEDNQGKKYAAKIIKDLMSQHEKAKAMKLINSEFEAIKSVDH